MRSVFLLILLLLAAMVEMERLEFFGLKKKKYLCVCVKKAKNGCEKLRCCKGRTSCQDFVRTTQKVKIEAKKKDEREILAQLKYLEYTAYGTNKHDRQISIQ